MKAFQMFLYFKKSVNKTHGCGHKIFFKMFFAVYRLSYKGKLNKKWNGTEEKGSEGGATGNSVNPVNLSVVKRPDPLLTLP